MEIKIFSSSKFIFVHTFLTFLAIACDSSRYSLVIDDAATLLSSLFPRWGFNTVFASIRVRSDIAFGVGAGTSDTADFFHLRA